MIKDLVAEESARQKKVINLIASENLTSDAVKQMLGSDLTDKYAEGRPGARYYGGLIKIDEIENEVERLAQEVFNTNYHVNTQPYSGSIANLAVYYAFLQPGDVFMGMELNQGGHLTHGHPVTLSGKLYQRVGYGVNEKTFLLDYDELEKKAKVAKPKLIISGASAYSRQIDFKRISEIAKSVGAIHMADISHIAGLVAAGLHPTPFGYADVVTTTTHKTLRGPRGALLFCKPEFTEVIDRAVFPGIQGGPHMNTIAAIGVCLEEALQPDFKGYAQTVIQNSQTLAQELINLGFVIITGGTDNHLFLVDLRPQNISGKIAQEKLEQAGIVVNMNTIPYDPATPKDPSGIRIGTAYITSKGMKLDQMKDLAAKINQALTS